jgi:ATP-dependent RNA helicase DeaD
MADEIKELIEQFLTNPSRVELTKNQKAPQTLSHFFQYVHPKDKEDEMIDYMATTPSKQIIIFSNSRQGVYDLHRSLRKQVKSVEMIHGGMDQMARTSIFNAFKEGRIKILIASDVAGRGLDFSRVTHVINFDMPRETENYTHRTGRAGRMGREGTALTLVTNRDLVVLDRLNKEKRVTMNWIGTPPSSKNEKNNKPRGTKKKPFKKKVKKEAPSEESAS